MTGVTYFLLYRYDPETANPKLPMPLGMPFRMGEWHDLYIKADEGWRFAHREVGRLFHRSHRAPAIRTAILP
jgi:hypothetical protein